MPVDVEPLPQGGGDGRPDAFDVGQLLLTGGHDGLQAAEGSCQRAGRGRADVADGQCDQDPPQRPVLALLKVFQQPLGIGRQLALVGAEELRLHQIVGGEVEQVTLVADHPGLQQRGRRLVPQPLDVQGAAAGEMKHPLPQLRRAGPRVRAADVDVALLGRGEQGPALRAVSRHDELPLGTVAQVDHRPEHLGDDVTGLADHHGVADQHALALDLRGVVQSGQADRRTGDPYRVHERERGDPAGAPDVDPDVTQDRLGLFRRVLVGHRPPRRTRGGAEAALLGEIVDLDHHTVDLVLDGVAAFAPETDLLLHRGQAGHLGGVAGDRQAPGFEREVGVVQAGRPEPFGVAKSVTDHPQRAARCHRRVLLPQ